MKTKKTLIESCILGGLRASLVCGMILLGLCWGQDECRAQSAPADMTPALTHVVNLSKGGMSDDFILTYITNSGSIYPLSDDDILYLHKQGVSDAIIKALMETAAPVVEAPVTAVPASSPTAVTVVSNPPVVVVPTLPPMTTVTSQPASALPAVPRPATAAPAIPPMMLPVAGAPAVAVGAPFEDRFFSDGGLNPTLWTRESSLLTALAAPVGVQVLPRLQFSPFGMRMEGTRGVKEWMGIQSLARFSAPFTITAKVSGLAQNATPFELSLVSADLRQWVDITGHLGGRGRMRGAVFIGGVFGHVGGDVRLPIGGSSPDYGIWVNHTGSGRPIGELGQKILPSPLAGVAYTLRISLAPNGAADVMIMDSVGDLLSSERVPVGVGPFYAVIAGRGGPTASEWQEVRITPWFP